MTSATPPDRPTVTSRSRQFLVAKDDTILAPASLGPLDFDFLVEQLVQTPGVQVARRAATNFRTFSLGTSLSDQVVVATMSDQVAADVRLHPQVVLEEDHLLYPHPAVPGAVATDPGLISPFGTGTTWDLTLTGRAGSPVANAAVYLYGSGVPAQGRTDSNGRVSLSLVGESDATLRALYVNPQSDYWSMWINRPVLVSGTANTVALQALADSFPGFPSQQVLGWGQRAMRLDHVLPTLTGRGVKVAVVDSGAAALTHPDLVAIHDGVDLTSTPQNTTQWTVDTIAHGSHCSGVIAAADNGSGVRGFAPDAEVHEARIFPGGRISSLLDALDYCIDHEIDVVNMSLGTGGNSQIMLDKIVSAKNQGVACIVAAGNTGGSVQFPGNSPDVLTVAAIGQDGTFPDNSYHAQQRWSQGHLDQGYFSAQFSCHGPEIDVAGPGVAIVSSVPDRGFASWDGTSMATPHIAGLAALVLAHHPDFQTDALKARVPARVDHLFKLIMDSATALDFGDPERSGKGLPDALRAIGIDGQPRNDVQTQAAQAGAIADLIAQLRAQMAAVDLAVDADPAATPVPAALPNVPRLLAELRAKMAAVDLPVDLPLDRATTAASLVKQALPV